jgi:hypothetical protein
MTSAVHCRSISCYLISRRRPGVKCKCSSRVTHYEQESWVVDVSGFPRRVRQRPPDSLTQLIDKLPVGLNTVVYASAHAVDVESLTNLFFQTIRTACSGDEIPPLESFAANAPTPPFFLSFWERQKAAGDDPAPFFYFLRELQMSVSPAEESLCCYV